VDTLPLDVVVSDIGRNLLTTVGELNDNEDDEETDICVGLIITSLCGADNKEK